MGVLDSRGDHLDPQVAISDTGGAIAATRITAAGEPSRALSISTRPGSRVRWSAPVRLRAPDASRHLVAAASGERLVAWQSPGQIWAGRPRRSGKGWERFLLDSHPGVRDLLNVTITNSGTAQVIWRTDTAVESAHVGPKAARFSRSVSLPVPASAQIASAGVSCSGSRAIVSWRDEATTGIAAAVRMRPDGDWEGQTVVSESDAPPIAVISSAGVSGLVWSGVGAIPRLARRVDGEAWTVTTAGGAAAGAPDLQINRRGALLSQWAPLAPSTVGGAYFPANRDTWIPTPATLGRGFLRDRQVDWLDPAAERLREGLPRNSTSADMQLLHVDERGDVFAALTDSRLGSLTIVQRPGRVRGKWNVRALSAIGVDRTRIAANRRGDVVVAFLTPSEFVPGTLNSGIATTSPALTLRGAREVRPNTPFVLRVGLPDKGRLTTQVGPARRVFGVARRRQLVRLRAPRRPGLYRVQFTLNTPDGRRYAAVHAVRVR